MPFIFGGVNGENTFFSDFGSGPVAKKDRIFEQWELRKSFIFRGYNFSKRKKVTLEGKGWRGVNVITKPSIRVVIWCDAG